MHPDALRAPLDDQLVKWLSALVSDVKEYRRIAYRLFLSQTAYIHRTSRQVVRVLRPTHGLIHLWTPIPGIDNDRLVVVPLAQPLKPSAHSLQVLDMYPTGDIPVLRLHTCFRQLSERKVRR